MKTHKKLLSALLSLMMLLSLALPSTALAADSSASPKADPATNTTYPAADAMPAGQVWTDKTVTVGADSGFEVTLSALTATQSGSSTTTATPLDIVLVLDTSGSMAFSMGGRDNNSNERMNAMKKAVNSFLDQVAGQNNKITGDDKASKEIQVALVTYASDAWVRQSMTSDTASLKRTVDGLRANGATRADLGLEKASEQTSYRSDAKKIVIFFTDGEPTSGSNFEDRVASRAVSAAKAMKDDGTVIYSVGIFSGADASADLNSNRTSPANKFMQAVSSNYPAASYTEQRGFFGRSEYNWSFGTAAENPTYYKAASTADELSAVFADIFAETTTSTAGAPAIADTLTFTDTLGEFMQVGSVNSITIDGKTFTEKTSSVNGNVTTYTFSGSVVPNNSVYTEQQDVSSIVITVTTEGNTQTVKAQIPAALVPMHETKVTTKNGESVTEIVSTATPVSISYSVSLSNEVKSQLSGKADVDDDLAAYISNHVDADGNISFYSNAYASGDNGTTTAVFTPTDGNTVNTKKVVAKTGNTTGTAANAAAVSVADGTVTQYLGNNGVLTYKGTADLTISKTVKSNVENVTHPEKEFTFTVKLTDAAGTDVTDKYVKTAISLKSGDSATIKDLPIGTVATVTESAASGYTADQTSKSAVVTASGAAVAFTNTYNASFDGTLQLKATKQLKTVQGNVQSLSEGQFTFGVYADASCSGNPLTTAANAADGSVTFNLSSDTFRTVGEHIYYLKEIVPETLAGGISYDNTVYTVTYTVSDDGAGKLTASEPVYSGDPVFTNTYKAEVPESTTFDLGAQKTLTGRDMAAGEFVFQVEDENGSVVATASNAADGSVSFKVTLDNPEIFAAQPETPETEEETAETAEAAEAEETETVGVMERWYTIRELSQGAGGVTYDSRVYMAKVTLADNGDGTLKVDSIQYYAADGTTAVDKAAFTNTYEADGGNDDGSLTVKITAAKALTGRTLQDGEFSFQLKGVSSSVNDQTVTNDADGNIVFTLNYKDQDGVGVQEKQEYVITETKGDDAQITYDASELHVTVTITDDGNGNLTAEVTPADELVFRNTYTAPTPDPVPAPEEPAAPSEPKKTTSEVKTTPKTAPKTADTASYTLAMTAGGCAFAALVVLACAGKRKKVQETEGRRLSHDDK